MTTARDVMTTPVLGVRPDMTVRELAAFFFEHQITGAPVMDSGQRLVGVVSTSDVTRSDEDLRALRLEDGEVLVQDIMTPGVFTVQEDAPTPVLARAMVHGRVHRLFVCRGRRVVGIVSSLDLLKLLFETGAHADGDGGSRGGRGAELDEERPAVPPGAPGDARSAAAGASQMVAASGPERDLTGTSGL